VKLFDTNTSEFLTPFELHVWLSVVLAITTIAVWIVWKEKELWAHVLHWQYATLLEQSEERNLRVNWGWGKFLVVTWIFSTILLRNFYTSSLYSLLAAERVPTDFPSSMVEIIDSADYQLLMPLEICENILLKVGLFQYFEELKSKRNLPKELVLFYPKILRKSSCAADEEVIQKAMQNGNVNVSYYLSKPHHPTSSLGVDVIDFIAAFEERNFVKVGIACKHNCEGNWNADREKPQHRIIPKQTPFYRIFEFWILYRPSFASNSFSAFLELLTQSGLHEFLVSQYRLWGQFEIQKRLGYKYSGMNNGSLFSYVFLANRKRVEEEDMEPTTISVFRGTLILTSGMLSLAVLAFIFELWKLQV